VTSPSVFLPTLLESRSDYKTRLELVMPASLTGTGATCSEMAAAAAFAAAARDEPDALLSRFDLPASEFDEL
jgi:hypothetical protein